MKNRLVFIDVLRGWAGIVMIEVHVVNALMQPHFREAEWFSVLNYINGLVAPSFLFVAGFIFVITSERKLDEFRSFGRVFWKQLGRIALIWIIGYGLHLPFFSYTRTITETTEEGWLKFYQADILHCIAVGLFVLFFCRIFIKRDVVLGGWLGSVGIAAVLIAPFFWDIDFVQSFRAPVAAYLNGQHYSQFPMFPWLGFMLLGAVLAMNYQQARGAQRESEWIKSSLKWGSLMAVGGFLLRQLPVTISFLSSNVRANPLFFAERLGIVMTFLSACWYHAERRKTEQSFVLDVSRESLLVYTAHLLIVYGNYWNRRNIADIYGGTFRVVESFAAAFFLIVLMVGAAKVWGWLKQKSLSNARLVSYATAIVVVVLFFIRKN